MNKLINKYTNYYGYRAMRRASSFEVSEDRLLKVIQAVRDLYKDPYLRFMWISGVTEATLLMYRDKKHFQRCTFSELEREVL